MNKPNVAAGYDDLVTESCERVLVTILRGLGPWCDSIFLIGGLTPRYLVQEKPPSIPKHAGTGDIDLVVQLALLADTEAYHTLEDNLTKLKFERGENNKGVRVSWRWKRHLPGGLTIILELLADDDEKSGGKMMELPTEGNISAMNIPHASMVFDYHRTTEIRAELLDDDGIVTQTVRYADIVSFGCLKVLAFNQRAERKDAHDLIYCLQYGEGGPEAAGDAFREARAGKHRVVVEEALELIAKHFADDAKTEGYLKDGPIAVAKFELGETDETREERVLRQRETNDVISRFLKAIG